MADDNITGRVQHIIRDLLSVTNELPPRPDGCGAWAEVIDSLWQARCNGGVEPARRVFDSLVMARPELAALVAGETTHRRVAWAADELMAAAFPEAVWFVPGILVEGLTILGGKRKLGKSWLALQLALALGTGGAVLGQQAKQSNVLYLALEDGPSRLQRRARLQGWPSQDVNVTFATHWDPLDGGGLAALEEAVTRSGYQVIIIDTLSRAISARPDQNNVSEMTQVVGGLQRLAQDMHIAILVVDHHNKASFSQDPVDDILGSSAKGAVADCLIGFYRDDRRKKTSKLSITGRDIEDKDIDLQWGSQHYCWQLSDGPAEPDGGGTTEREDEVLAAVRSLGKAHLAEIAQAAKQDRSNCHRRLKNLCEEGLVAREVEEGRDVFYRLTTHRPGESD